MARPKTKKKSLKVVLVENYYKSLGTRLAWDDQKILQLMEATRMEPEELAAVLRMTPRALEKAMIKPTKQLSLLLYQIAVSKGFYAPYPIKHSK